METFFPAVGRKQSSNATVDYKDSEKRLFRIYTSKESYVGISLDENEPFYHALEEACRRKRLPVDKYYLQALDQGHVTTPRLGACARGVDNCVRYHLQAKTVLRFTHALPVPVQCAISAPGPRGNTTASSQSHADMCAQCKLRTRCNGDSDSDCVPDDCDLVGSYLGMGHGFTVLGLHPETYRPGVYVDSVQPESELYTSCLLAPGDIILEVNGLLCHSAPFQRVVRELREETVTCTIATCRPAETIGQGAEVMEFDWDVYAGISGALLTADEISAMACPPFPASLSSPAVEIVQLRLQPPPTNSPRQQTVLQAALVAAKETEQLVSQLISQLDECDAAALRGREGHRVQALLELVQSEETYVRHLHILNEQWLTAIQRASWLSEQEKDVLCSNASELLVFHKQLLSNVQSAMDREVTGQGGAGVMETLLQSRSGFEQYKDYCAQSTSASNIIARLQGSPAYEALVAKCNPTGQLSSSLESYLIKPVQRLLKYSLLIDQINRYTPQHSPPADAAQQALDMFKAVTAMANEHKRSVENLAKKQSLLANLEGGSELQLQDLGELLFTSEVSAVRGKTERDRLEAYLFSSALLLCRKESRNSQVSVIKAKATPTSFRIRDVMAVQRLSVKAEEGRTDLVLVETMAGSKQRPASGWAESRTVVLDCPTVEIREMWVDRLAALQRNNQDKGASPNTRLMSSTK